MARLRLHMVVPGLLGPLPQRLHPMMDWPRPPVLEALLARSNRKKAAGAGTGELLFRLFGLNLPPSGELPSAALCRLGEGLSADDACWIHADPVHLQAERERVLLFDARHLDLTPEQAGSLVAELGAYYREDDWELETPDPRRWYLRLPSTPAGITHPLEQVTGRHIEQFMPRGEDAGFWRARLNESQMLLHGSIINRQREASGLMPINGLWFWGAGRLPERPGAAPFSAVYADHLLARGLARRMGMEPNDRPLDLEALLGTAPDGEVLLVLNQLEGPMLDGDPIGWGDGVRGLEIDWFAPLKTAMAERRVEQFTLCCPPGGSYSIRRSGWWRWWRRPGSLRECMLQGPS